MGEYENTSSDCAAPQVWIHGRSERIFRTSPIGKQPTSIVLQVPRLYCHRCHAVRQAKIDFADPKKRYTHAIARYAIDLSWLMTIQDVPLHLRNRAPKTIEAYVLQVRKLAVPRGSSIRKPVRVRHGAPAALCQFPRRGEVFSLQGAW